MNYSDDTVYVTEDFALLLNVSIDTLILEKKKQGFREKSRYQHPAVGTVVIMTRDYSLAG
jgi:hypothetical protein